MNSTERLRRLAARLARNRSVDWDAAERAMPEDEDRGAIRQLRLLAAIVGFHRAAQKAKSAADLSKGISTAMKIAGGTALGDALVPLDTSGSSHPGAEALLPAGARWGHLEVLERVGHGAFGEVFRARDTRLDRIVALKILAGESPVTTDETVREARLLARVRHPNVVTVFGADRIEGRVGIWMEFLRGQTLDRIIGTRGQLDAREAALIGIDLCRALSAVHATGIIHQDVKPGNVMRAEGGRIVLMDFGLGREAERARHARAFDTISGTPLFMAPDVLASGRADARSDIYSLGVVLFFLVTGGLPVDSSSLSDLLAKHERREIRRARDLRPDLPESFARVLERALAPEPKDRFGTPGEFEHALLHALGTRIEPAHPALSPGKGWWKAAAAIVFLAVLAIAIVFGLQLHPASQVETEALPAPFSDNPDLTLVGSSMGEFFGMAVAGVGDVDADGFADVLVGAPHFGGSLLNGGRICLYRGSKTGLDPTPAWTATGTEPGARFGWSIASVTNLTFDGFADLVVGAPGMDEGTLTKGRVYVYAGSRDGPAREPIQVLSDGVPGACFGYAIATGDVDHDGDDDLLIGEPEFPTPSSPGGRAFLYLAEGSAYASTPLWTAEGPANSQFGVSVDMGGDINNDGFRDAVVGAASASFGPDEVQAGAAYVYLGSVTGLDSVPIVLPGRQQGALSGRDVLIPGDLDGDRYADVVVGAASASNGEQGEGVVEVFFGSRTGIAPYSAVVLESNVPGANFGGHMGSLGDLDGKGCADLFIGAVRYQRTEPREGAAYIFSGSARRDPSRVWFRVCGKAGSWYGACGGSAGDVNADDLTDFVVSAPAWDSEAGINVGRVDLFLHVPRR